VLDDEPMRYITKDTTWRFHKHIPRHNNKQFPVAHSTHTRHNKETQQFIPNAWVSDDQAHHKSARKQSSTQKTKKQAINTN